MDIMEVQKICGVCGDKALGKHFDDAILFSEYGWLSVNKIII